jgi:probable phosphoglycerate mutase
METSLALFGCIRHSRTLWNEEKRVQGWQDSPLTDEGKRLACTWGKQLAALPWQRILASDLARARSTAELINATLSLPLHLDARLREQDWGEWSGLLYHDLLTSHQEEFSRQQARGWDFTPPGGESRHQVLKRSRQALHDAAKCWRGEQILVVSHEGVIRCLACHLAGQAFMPGEPHLLREWHLHCIGMRGEGMILERLNALSLEQPARNRPFSLF